MLDPRWAAAPPGALAQQQPGECSYAASQRAYPGWPGAAGPSQPFAQPAQPITPPLHPSSGCGGRHIDATAPAFGAAACAPAAAGGRHECDHRCVVRHEFGNLYRCVTSGMSHVCDATCDQRVAAGRWTICKLSRRELPLAEALPNRRAPAPPAAPPAAARLDAPRAAARRRTPRAWPPACSPARRPLSSSPARPRARGAARRPHPRAPAANPTPAGSAPTRAARRASGPAAASAPRPAAAAATP